MKFYALVALRANYDLLLGVYDEAHLDQGKRDAENYDHARHPMLGGRYWSGLTYTDFFTPFYRFVPMEANVIPKQEKPTEVRA